MEIKFFLLFIILFGLNMISAVGFSPSSLTFDLEPNQEECKMITIDSESRKINVSDRWAENQDVEWQIGLFETNASQHGINISYDKDLSKRERDAEVCLSGSNLGEYHGILLFRQEQAGSSIIQFGVWLKVVIAEQVVEEIQEETPPQSSSGGGGGGSGGGGGGFITKPKNSTNNTNSTINFTSLTNGAEENSGIEEEINEENTEENYAPGITGGAIWGNIKGKNLIIPGLVVIFAVGVLLFYNKRKNHLKQYGY